MLLSYLLSLSGPLSGLPLCAVSSPLHTERHCTSLSSPDEIDFCTEIHLMRRALLVPLPHVPLTTGNYPSAPVLLAPLASATVERDCLPPVACSAAVLRSHLRSMSAAPAAPCAPATVRSDALSRSTLAPAAVPLPSRCPLNTLAFRRSALLRHPELRTQTRENHPRTRARGICCSHRAAVCCRLPRDRPSRVGLHQLHHAIPRCITCTRPLHDLFLRPLLNNISVAHSSAVSATCVSTARPGLCRVLYTHSVQRKVTGGISTTPRLRPLALLTKSAHSRCPPSSQS
jgi:hypothetical protein